MGENYIHEIFIQILIRTVFDSIGKHNHYNQTLSIFGRPSSKHPCHLLDNILTHSFDEQTRIPESFFNFCRWSTFLWNSLLNLSLHVLVLEWQHALSLARLQRDLGVVISTGNTLYVMNLELMLLTLTHVWSENGKRCYITYMIHFQQAMSSNIQYNFI